MEERVFEGFLPADPIFLVDGQALGDEIDGELGELLTISNLLGIDCVDQLQLVRGHPGGLAVQHLVENEPDGP